MHAVFFEVRPHPGHLPHYFEHVARLKPVLARHIGMAFLDRYSALDDPGVLLSHQLWQDEAAIAAWRGDQVHRASQAAGRHVHFADYRIRVGERVLHLQPGVVDAPPNPPTRQDGSHVIALYGAQPVIAQGVASFESVNHRGKFISLASAEGFAAAAAWMTELAETASAEQAAAYRIERDYGLNDRVQAPR